MAGIALILFRWALFGFLLEGYGLFVLFGDFLGTMAGVARGLPVVGPVLGRVLDLVGRGGGGEELPV